MTGTESAPAREVAREVVGVLKTRTAFESAVAALADAGIGSGRLSVLSSHESLAAAGDEGKPWRDVLTALVGEVKYEGPLVASGLIVLAGGPTALALASVIGAAVGGVALKELIDEVSAKPHTEDFARAVEAGSIILWVRVDDSDMENRATEILISEDAENVHAEPVKG
ncbi:MAG: hypothetical protein HOH04_02325 [Rhodospirillaceae bacterium]|jgi:hypothetical protein|nr:hypothetical protein [Rhodospirillaceae bacterium]